MSKDEASQYRQLVERLMLLGWYRVGQDSIRDPGQRCWGFREGHVTDTPTSNERWIPATTQLAAMRILLNDLHRDRSSEMMASGLSR